MSPSAVMLILLTHTVAAAEVDIPKITNWGWECSDKQDLACASLKATCDKGGAESCYQLAYAGAIRGEELGGLNGMVKACKSGSAINCEFDRMMSELVKNWENPKEARRIRLKMEIHRVDHAIQGLKSTKQTFETALKRTSDRK